MLNAFDLNGTITEISVAALNRDRIQGMKRKSSVQGKNRRKKLKYAPTSTPLDLSMETSNSISTSFQDIHPLPTLHEKKRKSERSEIITSSPYKKALRESLEKIAEKERNKKVVPTPKAGKEKKYKHSLKQKKKKKENSEPVKEVVDKDCECYVCGMRWSHSKKGETWVLCSVCKLWVHEDCATFPRGNTVCDIC